MRQALLLLPLIAACAEIDESARLGPGDVADVTTTAVGLSMGFEEANPILAQCGPAAPVCGAVLKPAMKYAMVEAGMDPFEANVGVELPSWMAGCANLMVIMGAAVPVSAALGVGCGVGYLGHVGVIPPHVRDAP